MCMVFIIIFHQYSWGFGCTQKKTYDTKVLFTLLLPIWRFWSIMSFVYVSESEQASQLKMERRWEMQINGVVGIALCSTRTTAAADDAAVAQTESATEAAEAAVFQLQYTKCFPLKRAYIYTQPERSHNKVCWTRISKTIHARVDSRNAQNQSHTK